MLFSSGIQTNPHPNIFSQSKIPPHKTQIFLKPTSIPPIHKTLLKPLKTSSSKTLLEPSFPNDDTNQTQTKHSIKHKIHPPKLVLKFVWMEKNIGLAIDQMLPGYGTVPLSTYYFWPRKDAWEELKVMLESKPWISNKQMVVLLNQATDIINLWQQSGGDLGSSSSS